MAYETDKVIQVDIQAQYGTGGGTNDYEKLKNKPQINGNELIGNKTSEELGLVGTGTFEAHVNDFDNPHKVTKSQIGLDNVDNTSDLNKPISIAQQNAIDAVQTNLDEEITRATNAESGLKSQIDAEQTRATNAESTLQSNIDAERQRADEMEQSLQTKINTEISERKSADSTLKNTIDAETQRATGVENDLQEALTTETSARESADTQLQTNINTESNRAQTAEQTNATAISSINKKIPAQASESNQLADKNFVNSSINSSAAFFKGNYATQVDLLSIAWQTTDSSAANYVTNNDYAYVESIVAVEGDSWSTLHSGEAWRYLYTTGIDWQPQFKVNNSPFTAEQLAAINSGATTESIGQIETNKTNLASHVVDTSNPHNVTKQQVGLGNVDNTADANKPVSTAQKTYTDAQDLATLNSAKAYTDTQIGNINTLLTALDTGAGV